MNQILCSTGAIVGRPNGRNIKLLSEAVRYLECDGFELMMYESWYDKLNEITDFMRDFPASVPVLHVDKTVGEFISRCTATDTAEALRRFEINCRLATEVGAKKLVLHLWNGVGSDRNMSHNYECIGSLDRIATAHGTILTVENVVCEKTDPLDHLEKLAERYPNIHFTFDTKMAAFHGQLERLYEERSAPIRNRICHIHANDYGGGYKEWNRLQTLHIGDGHIDFDAFFSDIRKWGYKGTFTIESTAFRPDGSVDYNKLNQSLLAVRKYLQAHQ